MHFIFLEDRGRREIGFDSKSHLEGICEIIEGSDHFAFQNLFLAETKCSKPYTSSRENSEARVPNLTAKSSNALSASDKLDS